MKSPVIRGLVFMIAGQKGPHIVKTFSGTGADKKWNHILQIAIPDYDSCVQTMGSGIDVRRIIDIHFPTNAELEEIIPKSVLSQMPEDHSMVEMEDAWIYEVMMDHLREKHETQNKIEIFMGKKRWNTMMRHFTNPFSVAFCCVCGSPFYPKNQTLKRTEKVIDDFSGHWARIIHPQQNAGTAVMYATNQPDVGWLETNDLDGKIERGFVIIQSSPHFSDEHIKLTEFTLKGIDGKFYGPPKKDHDSLEFFIVYGDAKNVYPGKGFYQEHSLENDTFIEIKVSNHQKGLAHIQILKRQEKGGLKQIDSAVIFFLYC